jgi:hypothetical protein
VDSDLTEAVTALKDGFRTRAIPVTFGRAEAELVTTLKTKLRLPRRYRDFLLEADPLDVESVTPSERVRLIPASMLLDEQKGLALTPAGERRDNISENGWRPGWVVVGHSTLLGDPYFLDAGLADAEGDCPVYTAMSGTEQWKPRLCASSFALFVRILAIGMEVAQGFSARNIDMDDELVFREALGPRIRQYDPAAVKAGHWT